MEERTADEIAAIFSAAGDSVTVIGTAKTEDETSYGMKYERLVPILVNAIKELSANIETLNTKVAALEAG